ncbi:MAG: flagellar hook-length control protein FliK [Rhizobium sp.]|nr:flagellar hook-length control protein FliK [Rhizobium sp.]
MMDALSAPPAPVPGAIVQQGGSGARADQTDDGGFSKALSNSGNQEKEARLTEDGQATTTGTGEDAEQSVENRSKRPIIELSMSKAATGDQVQAELGDLSTDDLARLLAAARSKTTDANPQIEAGGRPAVAIETVSKAELAKAIGGLRDKKPTSEDDATTTTASTDELAAAEDAKSTDLSDVLRLLAGTPVEEVATGDKKDEGQDTGKGAIEHRAHGGLPEAIASGDGVASDDGAAPEDQDRTFRLVRADGKGQPLVLQNETKTGVDDTGEAAGIETVTVVDARRYIAPASTTNAASITAAMLGDTEWVSAMSSGSELANAAAHSSQGKVVNTLKLQMSPIELGSVTATLRLSGEELSVQLTVDNPAALRQLSNDTSDILKALRAQGLTVDHVQVNMQAPSVDRSADAGSNNAASQQQGQQAFQSGGQGGDSRAREDGNNSRVRTSDEWVAQQAEVSSTDARSARPDQLYV